MQSSNLYDTYNNGLSFTILIIPLLLRLSVNSTFQDSTAHSSNSMQVSLSSPSWLQVFRVRGTQSEWLETYGIRYGDSRLRIDPWALMTMTLFDSIYESYGFVTQLLIALHIANWVRRLILTNITNS